MPKHLTYIANMTLNDVMTDIQFLESDVESKEADADGKETEVAFQKGEVEENSVQLAAGTANSNKLIPAENVAVEITRQSGGTEVYYLYDIMINSDRIKSIPLMPEFAAKPIDIPLSVLCAPYPMEIPSAFVALPIAIEP